MQAGTFQPVMVDGLTENSKIVNASLRRLNILPYVYYVLLIVLMLYFGRMLGILRGFVFVFGVHILLNLPVIKLRSEGTLRTEKDAEIVHDELSSPQNFLTSLWLAKANQIDNLNDSENSIEFAVSGLCGLVSTQYKICVNNSINSDYRLEIQQNGSVIVESHLSVKSLDDVTHLQLETERTSVHAYSLLSLMLIQSKLKQYFASQGYEELEKELLIRPDVGLGEFLFASSQ